MHFMSVALIQAAFDNTAVPWASTFLFDGDRIGPSVTLVPSRRSVGFAEVLLMMSRPRYPGVRITANGNQLVSYHTETRIADAGVFYPITPSTEGGELYQQAFAEGHLNVFGRNTLAVEAEGEHAAQGGAIAHSVCGKRVVNYTSGQGVVYGVEQYYHAPGKCSTMVLEVAA